MADLKELSDQELRVILTKHGIDIPVTSSTRDLAIKKLSKVMTGNGTASSTAKVSAEPPDFLEEPIENRPSPSTRRRSVASKTIKTTKSRQRSSLAPNFLANSTRAEQRVHELDGEVSSEADNRSSTPVKTVNGNHGVQKNPTPQSDSPGPMGDEELLRQLAKHNIPIQAVNNKNRAILVKKLNHAIAKSKRESKKSVPKTPDSEEDSERGSEQESDTPDNASFVSAKESRKSTTPTLSFSPQHSLSIGNNSAYLSDDSALKPRLMDFTKPYIPPSLKAYSPSSLSTINVSLTRPTTNYAFTKPTPTAGRVINRFVEEQEPYDTGSDSDTDKAPIKTSPKKKWFPSMAWLQSKFTRSSNLSVNSATRPSVLEKLRSKLSILWQWQFIAVVLPLLAIAFFAIVAGVYIKASYADLPDSRDHLLAVGKIDPVLEHYFQNVKLLLEQETVARLCAGEDVPPLDSSTIMEQLKMNQSVLQKVQEITEASPQLGIVVDSGLWSAPSTRLPLWCSVKSYLWSVLFTLLIVLCGFGIVFAVHQLVTANQRQREKEEQEVYSLVEMIIDLLARHQSAMLVDRRPQDAFLAVTHVRDVLIPLKERQAKAKLWNKAVQFLEDNESRVRPEIQQIQGEDYRVWRWLPPSTAAYSPGGRGVTSAPDQTDDALGNSAGSSNAVTSRPKVWQGQAFSTDSTGVNSPPPYPLTQCLKVRNMFDAEVEVGDHWPVRIQDAILEKAEKGKVLHMAVDRGSREGCVYIKCASPDEAGKVYRSLHGWWFDGNLVTVKYLRPERYHYRFPDSANVSVPLKPSNDKRLSLPTKFWKSPLEHF